VTSREELAAAKVAKLSDILEHHRRGCPKQRVEEFVATGPHGERRKVIRCVDCGCEAVEIDGALKQVV
jgi:hypothetical protein